MDLDSVELEESRRERCAGVSSTPAESDLFNVDPDSMELEESRRERYDSITCKILYFGKRVRPDLLSAISIFNDACTVTYSLGYEKLSRTVDTYAEQARRVSL